MLLWTLGCMYLFELVFLIFLDIYPGVELLGHMVVLFLVFWETSIPFHTVPPTVYEAFLSSTSWPTFVICVLFVDSHSDSCEMISHCGFDLHFPDDYRCWASFHVPVGQLYVFFGKMSIQVFCPFFNRFFFFFKFWVVWATYIFWILTPYQSYNLQIFSPIL